MKNRFFVYQITNNVNGKIYIGKSNHQLKSGSTRWQIHQRIAKGGKTKYGSSYSVIHAAISKYGATNFSYIILCHTDTEIQALELEQEYIAKLKEDGKILYNITNGGEGMTGHKHSKKTRQAISAAQQGEKSANAILTEEDVKNIYILLEEGTSRSNIAKRYSLSKSSVNMIARGKRWAHLYPLFHPCKKETRMPKGDECSFSVLNSEQVRVIKGLLKNGISQASISKQFGVAPTTIQNINSGRTWTHVLR